VRPATESQPQSLTQVVQATVRAVAEDALRRVARLDAGVPFQPKTLLAVLSYCYARKIYGSAEIEDLMRRDAHFRQICGQEFLGARVFRRFRRENREILQGCLRDTLQRMAEAQARQALTAVPDAVDFSEEASRRITMAMFIDSMGLDED